MGKFEPNEKSLGIARRVAKLIGKDFDKDNVRYLSENLHEIYFNEIKKILKIDDDNLSFKSASYREISAYLEPTNDGLKNIFIDQQFDFWLSNFTFLNCVATFKLLTKPEWLKVDNLFQANLEMRYNPYTHESIRDDFLELYENHSDCLKISHWLTNSMLFFIICHELAHFKLKHLEVEHSKDLEFDADSLGLDFYDKLILEHQEEKSDYVWIKKEWFYSPVLLMNYFNIYELYIKSNYKIQINYESHPASIKRAEKIYHKIKLEYDYNELRHFQEGLMKGLNDLCEPLKLF